MRRDRLLVAEMIDAAERAVELVGARSVEEIEGDRLRREALLWTFTVLGEASTSVSDELKQRFSDVPWRNPIRLRNRVVHGYWSVDVAVLHATARQQLPDFLRQLRVIIATLDDD